MKLDKLIKMIGAIQVQRRKYKRHTTIEIIIDRETARKLTVLHRQVNTKYIV